VSELRRKALERIESDAARIAELEEALARCEEVYREQLMKVIVDRAAFRAVVESLPDSYIAAWSRDSEWALQTLRRRVPRGESGQVEAKEL
jgi:hypothetical protein